MKLSKLKLKLKLIICPHQLQRTLPDARICKNPKLYSSCLISTLNNIFPAQTHQFFRITVPFRPSAEGSFSAPKIEMIRPGRKLKKERDKMKAKRTTPPVRPFPA